MTRQMKRGGDHHKERTKTIAGTDASAQIKTMGIDCGNIKENLAFYAKADCEHVISGKNNSYIVLGRDRPGSKHEGYGGKGYTQCGMIDLVVGRMNTKDGPVEYFEYVKEEPPQPVLVDPMFVPYQPLKEGQTKDQVPVTWATDSARIYVSQYTDIDDNFKLSDGKVGNSKGKSGIGIKADAVRIIGNEGIKLVTNSDGTNSFGELLTNNGIDLIANDRGNALQPLVKGENLRECMEKTLEELIKIQSTLQGFVGQVIRANVDWGKHKHPPPVLNKDIFENPFLLSSAADINTTLEAKALDGFARHSKNLESIKGKFLKPNGSRYINSQFNNTN